MFSAEITVMKRQMSKQTNENELLRKEISVQKNNFAVMLHEADVKAQALAQSKYEQRLVEVRTEERTRLGQEIASLKSELAHANGLVNSHVDGMKDKENSVQELEALNQQLEDKNKELADALAQKKHQSDATQQQLIAAEETHKKELQKLEKTIEQLKKEKDLLEVQSNVSNSTEVEAFNLEIKNLKAELSESASQREQLEATIAELKSQNVNTEKAKATALTDSDSLKAKLVQLETTNKDLVSKLASITSEKNSLSSKSDDLNNLIKSNDEKLVILTSVFKKLGLSIESDSLQKNLEELKTKASQYDELNGKYADLNEIFEQVSSEKETLKSQLESLKHGNKEEAEKLQEYSSALQETVSNVYSLMLHNVNCLSFIDLYRRKY